MSNWPPPPASDKNGPAAPPGIQPPPSTRQGCGRAFAITIVLAGISILLVTLLSSRDHGYIPVLERSVGVVHIEGPIVDSRATVKALRRLRENDLIKAIVLRLETPGGGVAASEEIYREARKAYTENDKPVIVSMGSVAASGGYYIASSSQRIFATSGTITGSIGVISPMFNISETMSKLGIHENPIVSGEHKDTGNPFDPQSPSEIALLQGVINDMYRQFFQVVLMARHKQVAKAAADGAIEPVINSGQTKVPGQGKEWSTFTTGTVANAIGVPVAAETALRRLADGRVYTGEQALKVGLVDEIGTLQDAIDYAGNQTGLGDDPPTVDRNPGENVSSWFGSSVRRFVREITASTEVIELRSRF